MKPTFRISDVRSMREILYYLRPRNLRYNTTGRPILFQPTRTCLEHDLAPGPVAVSGLAQGTPENGRHVLCRRSGGAARAAVCAGERTANRSGAPHVVKPAAGKRREAAVREVLAGLGERVTFHS